jgi:hypothetical protein
VSVPEANPSAGKSRSRSRHETDLEQTESALPPHLQSSDHHRTEAEATRRKRAITIATLAAIVCAALLFASMAVGGKLYRRDRIGPQPPPQPVLSVPAVKQSQPEPASMPVPTPTSNLPQRASTLLIRLACRMLECEGCWRSGSGRCGSEDQRTGRSQDNEANWSRPISTDLGDATITPGPRRIVVNTSGIKRVRVGTNRTRPAYGSGRCGPFRALLICIYAVRK